MNNKCVNFVVSKACKIWIVLSVGKLIRKKGRWKEARSTLLSFLIDASGVFSLE